MLDSLNVFVVDIQTYLNENNREKVILTGHTCALGDSAYNVRLGLKRAKSMSDYLVKNGISSSVIEIQTKGESEPVADNQTSDGRALNRRVEIIIK